MIYTPLYTLIQGEDSDRVHSLTFCLGIKFHCSLADNRSIHSSLALDIHFQLR